MDKFGAALAALFLLAAPLQARQITSDELQLLLAVDVVILGEVHDNPEHHLNQAEAIRAIDPAAVVFEMLDGDQAAIVNRGDRSGDALGVAIGWADSGWPPFAIYAPLFEALDDARIYGMAVPGDQVSRAFRDGPAAVFGDDAARFGLDRPLPVGEQADREQMQLAAHCDALPVDMLPGMVAAQRLRDAAFARTVLDALAETGGPVAVVTGTGHARNDWGMPAALRRAAPELRVQSIGQLEAVGDLPEDPPFDLWLVTPPIDRPDPCAAFEGGRQGG